MQFAKFCVYISILAPNLYKNLYTVHIASEIIEDEYRENPENFKGSGFAEGCGSMDDIREAEKNTTNEWIASYFITPIIPVCVTLFVSIASLNGFSKIYFLDNKKRK